MAVKNEIWRDVTGFEGCEHFKGIYQVSDSGRVRILEHTNIDGVKKQARIYEVSDCQHNHATVSMQNGIHKKQLYIHRLVAMTFLENPLNKPVVNHKNSKKRDNRVSNLEWVTHKENIQHAHDQRKVRKDNGSQQQEKG